MSKLLNSDMFFLILLISFLVPNSFAQESGKVNTKGDVYISIADNFISLYPDSIAYKTEAKSYRWNYEQGLILYAFIQAYKISGDKKYFDYIKKNIDYYVDEDGAIKTYKLEQFNIDNIAPGRVLLYLYEETKLEKYKKAADLLRKQIQIHPRTINGGFWHKQIYPYQMWLDGLYMAQPFYAKYSLLNNDTLAYTDIAKQFLLVNEHLKDNLSGLYYHGWDESREQKWADPVKGTSSNFWGRSLGWFMMAMVDVLDYFPESHKDRIKIIEMFVDLSQSIIEYRDKESLMWYQVVDKGNLKGNYIETSASLMFIYALAKGFNKGYLCKNYYEIADESFNNMFSKYVTYDSNGNLFLNNVCSVGGLGGKPYRSGSFEYYISEPIRVNDFKGYGPFILAAFELAKLKE
jgi:unsaturated rhamnogalacturonyl hydrolase